MPIRTSSATVAHKGHDPGMTQSRASNPSRTDGWEYGGTSLSPNPVEHSAPRTLQKSPSISSMSTSSKKSNLPSAAEKSNHAASKAMFTTRRRQSSIPNAKATVGPRASDVPAGKRSVSNSVNAQYNAINGASAVASQDPFTHQLSINDISRFSFASIAPQQTDSAQEVKTDPLDFADFLAPINFDDFHNSITTANPSLSHFPLPGGGVIGRKSASEEHKPSTQSAVPVSTARKATHSASVGRKASTNSTTASNVNRTPSNTTSILKGRRQSQFPPNAFNNVTTTTTTATTATTTKAPRKSIGPGTFIAPEDPEHTAPRRFPSLAGRKSSAESQKALSARLASRGEDTTVDASKLTASPRAAKAKSFLVPTRTSSKDLRPASRTPDPSRPPSSGAARTPGRAPVSRSGTPGRTGTPGASSGNRRMSVYATGLGARTISPTDARRMKRMSMMPPAPPLPHTRISQAPPTPLPEPPAPRPRSTAQSPAPARKSITPSSWRTTPDPNRKSYSSGQSLSSSTSYNSVRNSAAISTRLSQNLSSTRLSMPKPKLDTTVAVDGGVPPVPAIPKAYESPHSEMDQPFFSASLSGLPPVDSPHSASPHMTSPADVLSPSEASRAPSTSSRNSLGVQAETEPRRHPPPVVINGKGLRPFRLPPLNLVPLSTPTAAKIDALRDQPAAPADRPETPPARRNIATTPSTPMTASRATFFSRSNIPSEDMTSTVARSSTSHLARFDLEDQRSPDEDSPRLASFDFDDLTPRRNISPFISSSLPKNGAEFSGHLRPNFGSELQRNGGQPKPSGPRAPSFSVTPKATEKPSPVEVDSAFTPSGLRRKPSRSQNEPRPEPVVPQDLDRARYGHMPPPRLPASATWGNLAAKASSPTQRPSYLTSRRKTSSSSITAGSPRQESLSSTQSGVVEGRPSTDSTRSTTAYPNRSASLLTATHGAADPRSPSSLPSYEIGLDKDDLSAEEEMKKLASKRKDFESAARELDALRRRARPVPRTSPTLAQQTFDLNIFERGEIVDYPDVYFTGTPTAKKIVGDPNQIASNFGYDDERGDYNIVEGDQLAYRYEVVDILGKGSFGQVVRCVDHKTGILVAVKIIRNKKRFHQQALVEVNILQKLRDWDPHNKHSCVNFEQSFYFRGHLCISTDLLGMNLYEFIKAHDFKGFSLKLIRRFTKQLLSSLILLHSHKVIHCDLKPENVLLAHPIHSEIKVIDFGSSCFENEKVYTYIQSRFYRSPEVILGMSYGMPIDMWSLGCILAELYTGYPIFPGENEQEQLACIMEVFGPPEKHLIEKSSRKKLFFDSLGKPRLTVSSKGRRRRPSSKDLRQVLKCDDEAFLDFITKCLRWDSARRMNPHEALAHEFITGVKPGSSRRTAAVATNSPVKRVGSVAGSSGTRPLPQPPTTSLKHGVAVRQDTAPNYSPNKGATRRQSNMNGFQQAASAKRASHAAAMSASHSNLSRMALGQGQRSMSNRSDLATAAATASLVK